MFDSIVEFEMFSIKTKLLFSLLLFVFDCILPVINGPHKQFGEKQKKMSARCCILNFQANTSLENDIIEI